MSDSDEEIVITQNSFFPGDSLEEELIHSEREDSFLAVGESVSNLFSFENSPSTSALALRTKSTEGSCGDLEGSVVAVHETENSAPKQKGKNVE